MGEDKNKNELFDLSGQENTINQLIKPINRDAVHRICSGQVVLSLGIAMKELVENSIDAGATRIDILLKEYGSELLEVSDNGSGVLKENFEALTLKHYTSKIREFSDLECIGTLGFRGEALSSLCALSDLVITTKHSSSDLATKITYDRNGKIISQVAVAREQGTTIKLENLFSTLPVRRKEFMKNLKREFNKMCQLLYAYCLVSKGIKFLCTNITNKGSKNIVVATDGHKTVRENVINIFGAKQISTLIDVDAVVPDEPISTEYGVKLVSGEELPFSLEFLISSVVHGSGRSTTDRQFYFINSRPCEPSRLIKLINDIYRQFNSSQYPFVFLNITTKSSLIDVNVTPDKRQVFVENEKLLLAIVKASLLEAFKVFPSTFKMQNLNISQMITSSTKSDRGIKRSITEGSIKKGSILERFQKKSKTEGSTPSDNSNLINVPKYKNVPNKSFEDNIEEEADRKLDMLIEIACKLSNENDSENVVSTATINENIVEDLEISLDQPTKSASRRKSIILNTSIEDIRKLLNQSSLEKDNKNIKVRFRSEIKPESNKSAEEELQKQILKTDFQKMDIIGQFNLGFIITKLNNDLFIVDQHATDEKYNFEQLQATTIIDSQILVNPKPLELTAGNESILIENLDVFKKNGFSFKIDDTGRIYVMHFKRSDFKAIPEYLKNVENYSPTNIHILLPHAVPTEHLARIILQDITNKAKYLRISKHIHAYRLISKKTPCTKKVALTAIPVSKNCIFGRDDIDEMLFMMQDSSHTICRPSRVRAMFASRACRKSVMIGKHLSKSDMKRLINHMGEIDQPWNCPHGRPTMRHLINLDLIEDSK